MKLLTSTVLAAIAAVASVASADVGGKPTNPARTGPAGCVRGGEIVYQQDETAKLADAATYSFRVYANKTWEYDNKADHAKQSTAGAGCMDAKTFGDLTAAIKSATWTVSSSGEHCTAADANQGVTFTVHGKRVFTQTICNEKKLDTKSDAALHTLAGIAYMVLPPSPLVTPVAP